MYRCGPSAEQCEYQHCRANGDKAKAWSCASFIIARSIRAFSLPGEEFFPIVPTSLLRLGPTRELCGDGSGRPEESRPYSILETTGIEVDNLPPNRDSGGGWVPAVFRRDKGKARTATGPGLCLWRGQDLNLRPPGYEPGELPNCSTPRRPV